MLFVFDGDDEGGAAHDIYQMLGISDVRAHVEANTEARR